ncbi:hypothetical protein RUND412_010950 [Rhizina undulata]
MSFYNRQGQLPPAEASESSPPSSPNRPCLKSFKSMPSLRRQISERLKASSSSSITEEPITKTISSTQESSRLSARSVDRISLQGSDGSLSPRRDSFVNPSNAHVSDPASAYDTKRRERSYSTLRKRFEGLIGPPPPLPCLCPVTILSVAASEHAAHLHVALKFGDPVNKAMKAILRPAAVEKQSNSIRTSLRRPSKSRVSNIIELYLAGKYTEVEDRIRGMFTKTYESLFSSPNFGDSWFLLEIQENLDGDVPVMTIFPSWEYETFLIHLRKSSQLGLTVSPNANEEPLLFIEKSRLTYQRIFSIKGLAKIGHLKSHEDSDVKTTLYIKDLNAQQGPTYEYEEDLRKIYYEIETFQEIGAHPSIVLPSGYVTFGPKVEQKIIGYISPYCVNGRLSNYLFLYSADGSIRKREITLAQKAMWAMQIISGIRHLCRAAKRPFGEGLGVNKVLLDHHFMAQLTGFVTREVKDLTKRWMVAPEIRRKGEWSPREIDVDGANKIRWDRNIDNSPKVPGSLSARTDTWSAFTSPTWTACPKALEIAEVYALGIVLWGLFEQIDLQYHIAPAEIYKGIVSWSQDSIIPLTWRKLVEACLEENPEERWDLDRVLATMVEEVGKLWAH